MTNETVIVNGWRTYCAQCYPEGLTEQQEKDFLHAFLAGAGLIHIAVKVALRNKNPAILEGVLMEMSKIEAVVKEANKD